LKLKRFVEEIMRRTKITKTIAGFSFILILILFLFCCGGYYYFKCLQGGQKKTCKLKIVSTEPKSPATLEAGQKLYINFKYELGPYEAVPIWARPRTNGRSTRGYRAHGSTVYRKSVNPKGTAQGYFFFDKPTTVDEIIIRMKDVNTKEYVCTSLKKCNFEWKGTSKPKDTKAFKNVSLEPGHETQVQVEVEKTGALLGRALLGFEGIEIEFDAESAKNKEILVCFFDIGQRPSRHCVRELAKKAGQLKEKGITIATVQASKIDKGKLDKWVEDNNISFAVGMVGDEEEKIRFKWGVKSLPWLILTDEGHIVRAEGFGVDELDEKAK